MNTVGAIGCIVLDAPTSCTPGHHDFTSAAINCLVNFLSHSFISIKPTSLKPLISSHIAIQHGKRPIGPTSPCRQRCPIKASPTCHHLFHVSLNVSFIVEGALHLPSECIPSLIPKPHPVDYPNPCHQPVP